MTTTIFENAATGTDADAVVVTDGRISAIAPLAECRDLVLGAHERIDLRGGHLAPAFTDAHVHTVQMATRSLELDLSDVDGFEAMAVRVRAALDDPASPGHTGSGWFLAGGWNQGEWTDRRPADLAALDALTGPRAVALHAADLHTYWLNSAAIDRLGLDPALAPQGVVSEEPAFAAQHEIERQIGDLLEARLSDVLQRFLEVGVAGIHDIDDHRALDFFRRLHADRALPLRVHKLTLHDELQRVAEQGIRTGGGDDWLDFGGIKLFSDGALGSHTCHMTEPFADLPGVTGVEAIDADGLRQAIRRCAGFGFTVAIHAIGDAAVRSAAAAIAEGPAGRVPHRIEHGQHIRGEDVDALARSGAVVVMQPESCISDIATVQKRLGDRDVVSYGWRTLRDRGIDVAFSSDAPVEGIDPLSGIRAATTRTRADGTPAGGWQPHERLNRAEAWRAYTTAPALAAGQHDRGALAPGMLADFIVLDTSPLDSAARVRQTVVGGVVRWDADLA